MAGNPVSHDYSGAQPNMNQGMYPNNMPMHPHIDPIPPQQHFQPQQNIGPQQHIQPQQRIPPQQHVSPATPYYPYYFAFGVHEMIWLVLIICIIGTLAILGIFFWPSSLKKENLTSKKSERRARQKEQEEAEQQEEAEMYCNYPEYTTEYK